MSSLQTSAANIKRLQRALGGSPQISVSSGTGSQGTINGRPSTSGGQATSPVALKQVDPKLVLLLSSIVLENLQASQGCIDGTQPGAGTLLRTLLKNDSSTVVVIGGTLNFTTPLDIAATKKLYLINCTINYNTTTASALFNMPANTSLTLCLLNSTINVNTGTAAWGALVSGPIDTIQFSIEADDSSLIGITATSGTAVLVHTTTSTLGSNTAEVTINGGTVTFNGSVAGLIWTTNTSVLALERFDFVAVLLANITLNKVLFVQAQKMYGCLVNGIFSAGQLPHYLVTVECQDTKFELTGERNDTTPDMVANNRAMVRLSTDEEGTHSEVEVIVDLTNTANTESRLIFSADPNGNDPKGKLACVRVAQLDNGVVRTNIDTVVWEAQRVTQCALDTTAGNAVSPTNTTIKAQQASIDLAVTGTIDAQVNEIKDITIDDSAAGTALSHTISADYLGRCYSLGSSSTPSSITFARLSGLGTATIAMLIDCIVCDTGSYPIFLATPGGTTQIGKLALTTVGGNVNTFLNSAPATLIIDLLVSLNPGTSNILTTTAGAGLSSLSAIGTIVNSGDFAALIAAVTASRIGALIA